ncbi:28881_t:CDS:2 [Gigaspora margarita]|uniref:28881_t:CDS:1 n=1 Tax=Gigaspora margarita TaxID=4874 RepID=A0ABN7VS75_GIGMA|nr:28881_t:CDS:2 [Gigaspora margarita]
MSASEALFFQEIEEPEPEKTIDISFEDWVSTIHRNQMTATNLEAIVSAGIKRKSKIAIYDKCPIPTF